MQTDVEESPAIADNPCNACAVSCGCCMNSEQQFNRGRCFQLLLNLRHWYFTR